MADSPHASAIRRAGYQLLDGAHVELYGLAADGADYTDVMTSGRGRSGWQNIGAPES